MPPASGQRAQARSHGRRPAFSRETNLRRRINIREEGRSVLIVTNGESTEKSYFDALKYEPWITPTKVVVKFEAGEPAAVVLRAAILRDDNDYDEAWAVCGLDEYNVTLVLPDAESRRVELVLSVPCFEIWLILHKSDKCPGFNSAKQVEKYLERLIPGWDKTNLRSSDFREGVDDAVTRARRLGEPPSANPSTGVWRVVESLRAQT